MKSQVRCQHSLTEKVTTVISVVEDNLLTIIIVVFVHVKLASKPLNLLSPMLDKQQSTKSTIFEIHIRLLHTYIMTSHSRSVNRVPIRDQIFI